MQKMSKFSSGVRVNAAEVLGKIGSEKAIPGLLCALQDEHWSVRGCSMGIIRQDRFRDGNTGVTVCPPE